MSESAIRGEQLFFGTKAWCVGCHSGVNLTSESYFNIGIGLDADDPDLGRYQVTHSERDWGTFKTPSVRTALYTAPYMHDGSLETLEDVVEWYAGGGRSNRNLSPRYKSIGVLTEQEKQDLVEFMKACAGPLPTVATGRLPE
jgi:cytochrome c peroxidase